MPKQQQITDHFNTDKDFKILFEYAPIGILVVGKRGIIKLTNSFSEKLFGYKKGGLKGQPLNELIPDGFKKIHEKHHAVFFKEPKERPMGLGLDLMAKRKDGTEFPVEVSLGNYEVNGEMYAIAYITDIGTRKKNEEELKNSEENLSKLNHELEQRVERRTAALAKAMDELGKSKEELVKSLEKEKELNELKSRFVTMASHEFRTPLATILSSAALIEKYSEKEDETKRRKHLQRIQSSVNNLTEILNDFLSLGKLEEGIVRYKPEPIQVGDFVRQVIEENNSMLKKGQKVFYHHIDGNHDAVADLHMFRNVIINLLSNAAKYSNEGQEINVTTQIITGLVEMIELRVKDHGIGIPEKDQVHLFERFFRAKNAINIEGTGLGLNIVKKYIELMHGTISFTSVLEEGTEFVVRIPVRVERTDKLP